MSWRPLPGNRAWAVNVTCEPTGGLLLLTVRVMEVGVPWVTVTEDADAFTVPSAAPMLVVQRPATLVAGVTRPLVLIVAQLVSLELHSTFPVRSCVDPSLKVPVADI